LLLVKTAYFKFPEGKIIIFCYFIFLRF
jgi:hypothetical protein